MRTVHSCDVLSPRQLAFLAERLPEPPRARTGRPAYSNRDLLPGILRVLRSCCRWRDLDQPGHPSGVTHRRRLGYRHRKKGYRRVWRTLLNLLVQSKRLDGSLISLDGTFIPSQEFTDQTGYSGKHRAVGTKQSRLWIAPGHLSPSAPPRAITTTEEWGFSPWPMFTRHRLSCVASCQTRRRRPSRPCWPTRATTACAPAVRPGARCPVPDSATTLCSRRPVRR